jgi:Zn ribbon nucleic-acid-binding protein
MTSSSPPSTRAPCVCPACVKHDSFRALINDYGEDSRTCSLCGQTRRTIDVSLPAFVQLAKSLVRYFFSEWQYNEHHGGDGLEQLLLRENPLIENGDPDVVEEIALRVFEKPYEKYDDGVTLFAGYDNGVQLPLLRSLSDDEAALVTRLRADLTRVNYFVVEREITEALRPLADRVSRQIPAGQHYFRARIGIAQRFRFGDDLEREGFIPLSGAAIGAPPPTKASAGRGNRQGVSFLYVASTVDTALAEVRPHPGHLVSIGTLAPDRALKIANFHDIAISNYAMSDAGLADFLLLQSINRELSEPITPDERDKYVLGQLITDVCRQLGFDGVQYRSSVATGHNLCLFEPGVFAHRPEEARVLRVERVSFDAISLESFAEPPAGHYP